MNNIKKDLVSVIINCRNGEPFLSECLDSVYDQSYKKWEIIFVNNYSTDNTKEIINKYDDRIKYTETEKLISLGEARNLALENCSGEYIAFLDSDDVWLSRKLSTQVEIFKSNMNFHACYSSGYYINNKSDIIGKFKTKSHSHNFFQLNLKSYEVNLSTLVIKNQIIKENKLLFDTNLSHAEDFDFFMNMSYGRNVYVEKDFLVKYRLHLNQNSRKSFLPWIEEGDYCYKKIIKNYTGIEIKYRKQLRFYRAKLNYYKARAMINNEMRGYAPYILIRYAFVHYKFFLLFVISCFPKVLWDIVHSYKKI